MATKPRIDGDTLRAGRALGWLRERVGLTQAQAAEAIPAPGMTTQYWQMHEGGRVPGIHKPAAQRRLIDALNLASGVAPPLEVQDLLDAIREGKEPIGQRPEGRMMRIARELGGGGPSNGGEDQAVFPTRDGNVVFSFPKDMTPDGYRDLEAYFAVFLKTRGND